MNSNTIFIVLIFTALFLELNITVFAVLWQKNKKNKPLYKYNHKNSEISMDIINQMSDHMKTYLYNSFGVEWIHSYINIKATYEVLSFASKL